MSSERRAVSEGRSWRPRMLFRRHRGNHVTPPPPPGPTDLEVQIARRTVEHWMPIDGRYPPPEVPYRVLALMYAQQCHAGQTLAAALDRELAR